MNKACFFVSPKHNCLHEMHTHAHTQIVAATGTINRQFYRTYSVNRWT